MSIWERSTRQSEEDRLIDRFTQRRSRPPAKPRVVVCSCGWFARATTPREARDVFYVHQLLADAGLAHIDQGPEDAA